MGSKTLPDQGRQVSASPGPEAFFHDSGFGVLYLCRGREARGFFESGISIFSPPIQRIRAEGHPLFAQQPLNARNGPFDPLDEVISGIQLEYRVDALVLVKGLDLLCIFLNCFQDWITGLGLFVPQREIDAVRPVLRLMGKDVFLETWKPQGAGHAPHP